MSNERICPNQETIRDEVRCMKEEGLVESDIAVDPEYAAKPLSDADRVEAFRNFQNDGSDTYQKIEDGVVGTYQKIEEGVVGAYKKIESGFVGAYKNVESQFVEHFLTRNGETIEDAKERLNKK